MTVSTPAGPRLLDAAIHSYLASRTDTPRLLKQAMAEDAGNLMARCFMGYLTRLAGDARNAARSTDLHRQLTERLITGEGTAWEHAHVTALGLWVADDLPNLMAHFEHMLDTWPTDVLTLRMLHHLTFYAGDAVRMRDSVMARLPDFAGHPLLGYVKGMAAFGLEEAGDYEAAERLGREAVETNPSDAWAAHAVAHVMEMQGRPDEGIDWIDALRSRWSETNNFRFHLSWHEALYHLARHDVDPALALYDVEVAPAVDDDFYLDLCNAASLLLRIEALGAEVGDRWGPLVAVAERHAEDTELVFASLHHLMPLARTCSPASDKLLDALTGWSQRDTAQGRLVRDVALPVAAFVVSAVSGDRAAASRHFEAFRHRLHRIGGSHAQRALFSIMNGADAWRRS